MVGRQKREMWANKARTIPSKEKNFQLLGNLGVQRWDDADDQCWGKRAPQISMSSSSVHFEREKVLEKIQKEDQKRKRKMFLDRWDAHLDQGRQKKIRSPTKASPIPGRNDPKKNQFQALQAGVQRAARGKPKGHGWQHKKGDRKLFPNNHLRR
jgi:hypothetical protein